MPQPRQVRADNVAAVDQSRRGEDTDPERIHVLLGTPIAGGVVTQEFLHTALALQRRFLELGWSLTVATRPDGLVTRSRNKFASQVVLNADFTHLLMIDSDISIKPEAVERLINSGHLLTGAIVPLRVVEWQRVHALIDAIPGASAEELEAFSHQYAVEFLSSGQTQVSKNGFLSVRSLGSAVMLIRREALVKLSDSPTVAKFEPAVPQESEAEIGWTFFDPFVDERSVYLSEDYAFCHRWRAAEGFVYADLQSAVSHVGPVAINGDFAATLAVSKKLNAKQTRTHL
jgi:hypothetical protein